MMKSKIHRATVTGASVDYEGSITIDRALMDAVDILPHEQVHVLDVTNGARLVTYALPGNPGEICVNGAAARMVEVGDIVIIISYAELAPAEIEGFQPKVARVSADNRIMSLKGGDQAQGAHLETGRQRDHVTGRND